MKFLKKFTPESFSLLRVSLFLLIIPFVVSCIPTQRPLKNGQGYVVVPAGENHYRIEYYLKHAKLAETYWSTTAGQLCPGGFQVLYSKKHTLNFDMYVPIAGNNVNLGRQEFIQYGQVACKGTASNTVMLTESKWKEFNQETHSVTPVSDRWLTETLKLYVSHLPELPINNSAAALQKTWGKPQQQQNNNNELFSVWIKGGDSWFPNQIGLLEKGGNLKLVIVVPGVSSVMAGLIDKSKLKNKNMESLITSGILPAYFYKVK